MRFQEPDGMARRDRPILIFGAPRSGTSLLSRLLNAHSRIAIPFESHLFNQWLGRLPHYGDLSRRDNQRQLISDIVTFGVVRDWRPIPDPEDVLARTDGPGFAAVSRAFMDWAAETQGKPRWGEKTPHHTLLHREVLDAWNDPLVVVIERDPRDVALSWKQARFGGNHVLPFARAWDRYVAACEEVRRKLGPDRVFDVRYEALVSSPRKTLTDLMIFLDEEFEERQLSFHQSGEVWKTDNRNQERLQTPISNRSVGLWKSSLSPREVRLIESVAGKAMERRRYPRFSSGGHPRHFVLARWVGFPAQRVIGLARNARGLVYLGRDVAWRFRAVGGRKLMGA
jgi:hypothetical protein